MFDINLNELNSFKVAIKPYSGKDYSTKAFIFPGQGRILPQTYKNLFSIPIVRETFQEADDISSTCSLSPISGMIFNNFSGDGVGDEIHDDHTARMKNLFQYTATIAWFRFMIDQGVDPKLISTHSFGEYPALHSMGVYDFATGFKICNLRESVSPRIDEHGTMVVVSANHERIKDLGLGFEVYVANVNHPKQTVLTVPNKNKKGLLKALRKNRLAAKEMKSLGRPYHSPIMEPFSVKMAKALSDFNIEIGPLQYNFLSSVSRKFYEKGYLFTQEELKELLVNQLLLPIDFVKQMKTLNEHGVRSFVELSTNAVVSDFARETNFDLGLDSHCVAAGDLFEKKNTQADYQKIDFKVSDAKLLKTVTGFISKVTGYNLEEISINQRFEDDLRIDSIKKAEILFHTLENSRLSSENQFELSSIKYVGDLVGYIEKRKANQSEDTVETQKAQFDLAAWEWIESDRIQQNFQKDADFDQINFADLDSVNQIKSPKVVLYISPFERMFAAQNVQKLGALIDNWGKTFENCTLLLSSKTQGSHIYSIRAFLLCLRKENVEFTVKTLVSKREVSKSVLVAELYGPQKCLDLKYDGVHRYVQVLSPLSKELSSSEVKPLKVLSFGGSRGILKYFFLNSVKSKDIDLVFSGRSAASSDVVSKSLEEIALKTNNCKYVECDVTDLEKVKTLFASLKKLNWKPDIIIDGSGVEVSKNFKDKSKDEILQEFKAKTSSLENINVAIDAEKLETKVLQFNSIASRYGNEGQSVYSLGDGWSLGNKVSHIVWPAIDKLGMTENLGIYQKLVSKGVDLLPKSQMVSSLESVIDHVMCNDEPVVVDVISLKDRLLLQMQLVSRTYSKNSLGSLSSIQPVEFKKTYSREDMEFLNDHIISGKYIAPGCLGFASFYTAAAVYLGAPPTISDFKLKGLIPLESGPTDVHLRVEPVGVTQLELSVHSRVEHYSAVASIESTKSFKLQKLGETQFKAEINDFYSTKYVYHGPSFQVLDTVEMTSDGRCISSCRSDGSPFFNSEPFDSLAKMMEGVFQTAGFLATWHDLVSLVPTYFTKFINLGAELTDELTIVSSPLRKLKNPERWVCDVTVYNKTLNPCFGFSDVTGMKLKTYSKFPIEFGKS